jgi:hypothetical protein
VKDQRPDDQQGRRMFNDQVCGQLGRAMGVAVPHVALVEIPSELIGANPKQMGHLKPCVAHGSRRLPDMTGKLGGFDHHEKGDNRSRYCGLSVFFGWLFGGDVQFIQTQQPPHTVYSHDHGHFFPGGPMWTNASLAANAAQKAAPHPQLVAHLHLTPAELSWALGLLQAVTPDDIVTAVSSPPTEWQVPLDDRVALARFLHKRHGDLVSSLAQSPAGKAAP